MVPETAGWGDVGRGLDHIDVYLEGLLPSEARHLPALASKQQEYYGTHMHQMKAQNRRHM